MNVASSCTQKPVDLDQQIEKIYPELLHHARRLNPRMMQPEDLVQESVVRALRFLDGGGRTIGTSLKGFLCTSMLNILRDQHRTGERAVTRELVEEAVAMAADPACHCDAREQLADLRSSILARLENMAPAEQLMLMFGVLRCLLTEGDRLVVEQSVVESTGRTRAAVRTAVSRLMKALVPQVLDGAFATIRD